MKDTVNLIFAGRGGGGIITASGICASAALLSGYDVKKSDMKGIAQRGGLVVSHVRFGAKVFSPRVEPGGADFVVCVNEAPGAEKYLAPQGTMIKAPSGLGRTANVYVLGLLSMHLPFEESAWVAAIGEHFTDGVTAENTRVFLKGRASVPEKTAIA